MIDAVMAKSQYCSGSVYKKTQSNGFWLEFFLYFGGDTFVGRNWITKGHNGCCSNNSPSGGDYWQLWKAENKGYKGNKVTVKVQNMFSNLIFYLNLWQI